MENNHSRPTWPGPGRYTKRGGELPLSGQALSELLRSVLAKGASFRFRARGFSMFPFIKNDDVVTVAPLGGVRPGLGDVVAFIHPETGKLGVHRIIRGRGDSFFIKGDNNPEADGLIPGANILGRVKRLERKGKKIHSGLGPEKIVLSLLARLNLFTGVLIPAWRILGPVFKGSKP